MTPERQWLVDGASEPFCGACFGSAGRPPAVPAAQLVAQPAAFQQACGCVQADAEVIEADLAAEERVSGLAHAARQRRRVVARRGHGTAHWQLARIIGHGAMVRRSRAGRGVDAGHSGTLQGQWQWIDRRRAAFRTVLGGGPLWQLVRSITYCLLAPNG